MLFSSLEGIQTPLHKPSCSSSSCSFSSAAGILLRRKVRPLKTLRKAATFFSLLPPFLACFGRSVMVATSFHGAMLLFCFLSICCCCCRGFRCSFASFWNVSLCLSTEKGVSFSKIFLFFLLFWLLGY